MGRREHPVSVGGIVEEEVEAFLPVLDHAREYVVSALWKWSDPPSLVEPLEQLKAALAQRDAQAATRAISRAHGLIARFGDLESARVEGINLDVVTLVLDRAAVLLARRERAG